MPTTLREWVAVVACSSLMLFSGISKAGLTTVGSAPLDECTRYGAFAFDVFKLIERRTPADQFMGQVFSLMAERNMSIPQERLEAIVSAAKIHPRGAWEFLEEVAGNCQKKEGYFKVASSENLIKGLKIANCQTALQDEKIIHDYVANGWTQEELLALARRAPDLDENRRASVINLINEAFAHEGGVGAWFDAKWQACTE